MINKDIEEMERKELKIIFEENKFLKNNYIGETSKPDLKTKAFLKILLINYVLIFIMFFVPTLKILDKWKIRILLLALVFIFEFILLIVDDFLQIFSQNLLLLIAVNIVLAIGLVVLDGFLRRNFLKWYD
jgi:predicted neutral ceramidase superfamily lipid hydrolase